MPYYMNGIFGNQAAGGTPAPGSQAAAKAQEEQKQAGLVKPPDLSQLLGGMTAPIQAGLSAG